MESQPLTKTEGHPRARRCGMAALVGRANVGKSSLLNRMLGEKVSIVSPVPQTTRNAVRGILTEPRGQIAFIDTPGIHAAQTDLGRIMNRSARAAVEGVDTVVLVLDRSLPPRDGDLGWMRRLTAPGVSTPVTLVFNKSDLPADFSEAYLDAWRRPREDAAPPAPAPVMQVSALSGAGIPALLDLLYDCMPEGPQLFPDDVVTDYPKRLIIADTVREKLFLRLREEMPHRVAVWIEELDEQPDAWVAHTVICVERHSQKGIVIGHKGRMLRAIRRAAEAELQSVYGHPIRLDLHVKLEPKWMKNYWLLKRMGYVE